MRERQREIEVIREGKGEHSESWQPNESSYFWFTGQLERITFRGEICLSLFGKYYYIGEYQKQIDIVSLFVGISGYPETRHFFSVVPDLLTVWFHVHPSIWSWVQIHVASQNLSNLIGGLRVDSLSLIHILPHSKMSNIYFSFPHRSHGKKKPAKCEKWPR